MLLDLTRASRQTMYSFWVPQIWRTAIRGERGGILPKYAIGVSLTRLFIPICTLHLGQRIAT